eukprot:753572-Hanusia_phi.AAC.9
MLEWHFVIEGPAGSPYQGGYYHGIIRFPQEYPYKPPSIRMLTPSGRFEPNQRICLSMSDFHPETWNCMWSVSSILQGVVSFMLDSVPAIGTITTSESVKRQAFYRDVDEQNNPELAAEEEDLSELDVASSTSQSSFSSTLFPVLFALVAVVGGLFFLLSLQPQSAPDNL